MPQNSVIHITDNSKIVFPLVLDTLTDEQMTERADEDGFVRANVLIDLHEAVSKDLEDFLDFVTEKAFGIVCASDISYGVTGFSDDGKIVLFVSADLSDHLNSLFSCHV